MRFALDEDVSHPLASLLRSHGYDADSAKELGRLGLTDVQVLLRAATSDQVVITHNNKDFRLLQEAWITWRQGWAAEAARLIDGQVRLSGHAGILIVPQVPNHDLARIIEPFVVSNPTVKDRLFAWNAAKSWHEIGS